MRCGCRRVKKDSALSGTNANFEYSSNFSYISYPQVAGFLKDLPHINLVAPGQVLVNVLDSSTNSKTIAIPNALKCPSTCDKFCRRNDRTKDGTFQVTTEPGALTAKRTDSTDGWTMKTVLPCLVPASGASASNAIITVGSSMLADKVINVPVGTVCPSKCGRYCRQNDPLSTANDNFQLSVANDKLTVHRLDSTTGAGGWGMNLQVPCYVPLNKDDNVTLNVGNSNDPTKLIPVPANLNCPSPCGKGCRVNTDAPNAADSFNINMDNGFAVVSQTDPGTSSWAMNLQVPCKVSP